MQTECKLQLLPGRPTNVAGRLPKEVRCYDLLDSLSIYYERIDHEPMATIADCEEVDKLLEVPICKNLFLCNSQKTNFYLFMLPGHKKFDTKQISKQLNTARLSFANETFLEELLDLTPGSVTLLGLMKDIDHKVQLVIDQDVLQEEYIACHPCINTSSIRMKTADVVNILLPHILHNPILVELISP